MWSKILNWFDNIFDEIVAGAIGAWIMEVIFPSNLSIAAAVVLAVVLGVRILKIIIVSRNQSVSDTQNLDNKKQAIQKVKSIRKFISSPIMIFGGVLIGVLFLFILIVELDQSDDREQFTNYAILQSVIDDVVIVRANVHTESKYVTDAAIRGCLRVNKNFRPINTGMTAEYPQTPMGTTYLEFSFKCMNEDKITDIIKEEQTIFEILNQDK